MAKYLGSGKRQAAKPSGNGGITVVASFQFGKPHIMYFCVMWAPCMKAHAH